VTHVDLDDTVSSVLCRRAPFHLTRRGWGEFPVRVQLHFKDGVTKSIDIIHKLTVRNLCRDNDLLCPVFLTRPSVISLCLSLFYSYVNLTWVVFPQSLFSAGFFFVYFFCILLRICQNYKLSR